MNNRSSKVGSVPIGINRDGIVLGEGNESVPFTPAEAEAVSKLLFTANSMAGLKVFPPHITSTPFRITFSKDGYMTLFKKGQRNNEGLVFKFRDIDNIIRAITESVKMYRDEQIHRGGPRTGRAADTAGEPPIEGLI